MGTRGQGDKGTRGQGDKEELPMPNVPCPLPNAPFPITHFQIESTSIPGKFLIADKQ
ncbi:hypothetical protein [Tolypothrix sp. VBCCA 56010]|uniref:hypothetical protein n=1 Tax=Tolypothrix sp. VBCCA 56010 TaxID=3137731 RepID=UPI003D7E8C00